MKQVKTDLIKIMNLSLIYGSLSTEFYGIMVNFLFLTSWYLNTDCPTKLESRKTAFIRKPNVRNKILDSSHKISLVMALITFYWKKSTS